MSNLSSSQKRGRRERIRQLTAAAVAIAGLVLLALLAYDGGLFSSGQYTIRGVFASANELQLGSDVRISGIAVGSVSAIQPGPHNTSIVDMRISSSGLPVHTDARLHILPRLILEGNDYVDVDPGTARAPDLASGGTIPESQTTDPIQIDQVLDTFNLAGRDALHQTIAGLSGGLGYGGARAGHDMTGAQGLQQAARALNGALSSVRQVAAAAQGTEPGDLPRAVSSTESLTAQLASNPSALAALVTHYNSVFGVLASSDRQLAATISGLDDVVRQAPPTLTALDSALPVLTRFAAPLRPTLVAAPTTFVKTNLLLKQVAGLVSPSELPAALHELAPVTATLPGLEQRLGQLFPQVTAAAGCITHTVVPTLDEKIQDGANTTGDPAWLDLVHTAVTLAGGSPNFDGNGTAIRLGVTEGANVINAVVPGLGSVVGEGPQIQGVRPAWLGLGVLPPNRPDVPCAKQAPANLNTRSGPAPAWAQSATETPTP